VRILAFGKDPEGKPLFKPYEETAVAKSLLTALKREITGVRTQTAATERRVRLRGEMQRAVVDAGDPREAGWSFVVARDDPERAEIVRMVRPLAEHRGMADPTAPILFSGEPASEWDSWLLNYSLGHEFKFPQYLLMVGEPARLPFQLQSLLGTVASVGRVSFPDLSDLDRYVQKVLRLENARDPVVRRQAILFGPDDDSELEPTFFSRKHMVEPLSSRIGDKLGFEVSSLVGEEATKEGLVGMLRASNPALVYTASHGLAASTKSAQIQMRYNGAICCQFDGSGRMDCIFSADDVPMDEPFLEGAVFFQFACFGYGTPAESDYHHWLRGVPKRYAQSDFLAALPRRLLAHPRGPIAYVGHLDTAFLHGFYDPREPLGAERWNSRIQPYVRAVEQLLSVQPAGLAMEDIRKRLHLCNHSLMIYYDRQRRGTLDLNTESTRQLVDHWIYRGDAQNYMIFGDPAARVRIPIA